jgi:hypothetical protein
MTRLVLGLLMLLTPLAVLFAANYDPAASDISSRQRQTVHPPGVTNPAAHHPIACGRAPVGRQASAAQAPVLLLELLVVSTVAIADTLGPLSGRYPAATEPESGCAAGS